MPFLNKGSWNPNGGSYIIGGSGGASTVNPGHGVSTIIANSGVVRRGDVIASTTSGNLIVMRRYNAQSDTIVGVLLGVRRASGLEVSPDSGTTDTWTVGSDNETAAKIYGIIDTSPWTIWSAPSSATLGTTAIPGIGAFCDPNTGANAGQILESSLTRTVTNGRGLTCHGHDPEDTTRVLVSISETYLLAGLKGDS